MTRNTPSLLNIEGSLIFFSIKDITSEDSKWSVSDLAGGTTVFRNISFCAPIFIEKKLNILITDSSSALERSS